MEIKMKKNKTPESVGNNSLSKTALRRQREREHRYESILSAAELLFAREGYLQASMERIADSAEVSVGTLYFYFKNKEDLLVHLLDKISFELRELLGSEFIKADFSLDGIKSAGHVFLKSSALNILRNSLFFLKNRWEEAILLKNTADKFLTNS